MMQAVMILARLAIGRGWFPPCAARMPAPGVPTTASAAFGQSGCGGAPGSTRSGGATAMPSFRQKAPWRRVLEPITPGDRNLRRNAARDRNRGRNTGRDRNRGREKAPDRGDGALRAPQLLLLRPPPQPTPNRPGRPAPFVAW